MIADVQKIQGRVSVPSYGDHEVRVYLGSAGSSMAALAEVDLPDGRTVRLDLEGPEVDRLDAQMMLSSAVRAALAGEEATHRQMHPMDEGES